MVQRRTLAQALQTSDLSETAIAFVSGSPPQASEIKCYSRTDESSISAVTSPQISEEPSDASRQGTVSVTFRLPADLSSRLLRVSLDRKLRGAKPFTQQAIFADALAHWLKKRDDSL